MGAGQAAALARLVLDVLRSREPQGVLEALTGAGTAVLPSEVLGLYAVQDGRLASYPAVPDPPDGSVDRAAAEAVSTGERQLLRGVLGGTLVLPLAADGQRFGALAVAVGDPAAITAPAPASPVPDPAAFPAPDPVARPVTDAGDRVTEAEALDVLAQACALALRTGEETGPLAEAVSAAQAGVFAWDFSDGHVYWDDRACAIYGVDPAEFDGRGERFFDVLHPDDLPGLQAAIADLAENAASGASSPGYRLDYRVVHPDGGVHHVTERGRVALDDAGRPARILGLVTLKERPRTPPARTAAAADTSRDAFLFTLTRAMSKAVTVRDVTRVMTHLVRPALGAENLVLGVLEAGRMRVVGETRIAPALEHLRGPARAAMLRATRHGQPLFIEDISRRTRPDAPGLAAAQDLPARSWAVLPLGTADHVTGACLISFPQPRRYDAGERTFYTAVAAVLTQSLERAQLFDTEHQRASDLQKAMLPRNLPTLPLLETHSGYLPGTRGMHIGGDWYDVVPLGDRTAALIIGDVQGHDAHASAVMGQLRVALRTLAEEGMEPGTVLARVNRVLCDLETDRFATCAYLVLDPADGTVEGARAGHPHPLRVHPEGVSEVHLAGGPPLGVDPAALYPTTMARLDPEDVLLLFTDGLVERRGTDIDRSLEEMEETIHRWMRTVALDGARPVDLAALVELLALRESQTPRSDDVALLAVRRTT